MKMPLCGFIHPLGDLWTRRPPRVVSRFFITRTKVSSPQCLEATFRSTAVSLSCLLSPLGSLLCRPGSCAGVGQASGYRTSNDFPDATLSFIKSHPLLDEAVASVAEQPWFIKTSSR